MYCNHFFIHFLLGAFQCPWVVFTCKEPFDDNCLGIQIERERERHTYIDSFTANWSNTQS